MASSASTKNCATPPSPGVNLANCNLQGKSFLHGNFKDANLRGANLQEADLRDANFQGAQLYGANLSGAYITGTNFSGDDLSDVNLSYTNGNLRENPANGRTNFSNANFAGSSFHNSEIVGAIMTNARLKGAYVGGFDASSIVGKPHNFPPKTGLRDGSLVGPGLVMINTYFHNVSFAGLSLINADIQGDIFFKVDLKGVAFTGPLQQIAFVSCNLTGANFVGMTLDLVNFSKSNLTKVHFLVSTLQGVNLTDTDLKNSWFSGAHMSYITSSGIIGRPQNFPSGWLIAAGQFIQGPQS